MTAELFSNLSLSDLVELSNACSDAEVLWRQRRQNAQQPMASQSVYEYTEELCLQRINTYFQLNERITYLIAQDDEDL